MAESLIDPEGSRDEAEGNKQPIQSGCQRQEIILEGEEVRPPP